MRSSPARKNSSVPRTSAQRSVRLCGSQSATSRQKRLSSTGSAWNGVPASALERPHERDAEPLRPGRPVARVTVEQLQDACRLAERPDAVLELRRVDGVDQPDTAVHAQGVRGALEGLVDRPAEAVLLLVNG